MLLKVVKSKLIFLHLDYNNNSNFRNGDMLESSFWTTFSNQNDTRTNFEQNECEFRQSLCTKPIQVTTKYIDLNVASWFKLITLLAGFFSYGVFRDLR